MLVTLNAITTKITKGTTPTSVGCTFENSGVNYIKSESLGSSRNINKSKFAFISEQTHEKLKRSQIEKNDILFSMAGMFLGKTGIVTADLVPANTNQAVAIIRIDNEKANHEYVYYYLNLKSVMQAINASSAQSAQPNINLKQIGQLEIDLPGRKVQDKIVSILSAIDFKIEKNKQINENFSGLKVNAGDIKFTRHEFRKKYIPKSCKSVAFFLIRDNSISYRRNKSIKAI